MTSEARRWSQFTILAKYLFLEKKTNNNNNHNVGSHG
jgi:hypothetical protein